MNISNIMTYQDQTNIRGLANSMASGTIPYSMYKKKMSATNMYESPHIVENYMRKTLADFTPDAPFFASDEPRYDTKAKEFLATRYEGSRSGGLEPWLPEGTNIHTEFLEKDPRGVATQPNFRSVIDQYASRGASFFKTNDDDLSIPESHPTFADDVALRHKLHQNLKDRYINFDDSLDNWTGSRINTHKTANRDNTTLDGTTKNLTHIEQGNRTDAITKLSNDSSMAQHLFSTPSHKFKTAKYGQVRAFQKNTDPSVDYSEISQTQYDSTVGYVSTKTLAHKIKQRVNADFTMDQIDSQTTNMNNRSIVNRIDLSRVNLSDNTQVMANSKKTQQRRLHKPVLINENHSQNSQTLITYMEDAISSRHYTRVSDYNKAREKIQQSGIINTTQSVASNKRPNRKISQKLLSDQTQERVDSSITKNVTSYKNIQPISRTNSTSEVYGSESSVTGQRFSKIDTTRSSNVNTTHNVHEKSTINSFKAPRKYSTPMSVLESSHSNLDINDQ